MKRTRIIVGLILIAGCLLLAGCPSRSENEDSKKLVIRKYVPPPNVDKKSLENSLRRSFDTGEQALGTVRRYPDGSLVVTAPESIQEGVEELISKFDENEPEGQRSVAQATITYWILVGRSAGEGVRIPEGQEQVFAKVRPVLDQIVANQGGVEFRLAENLRLTSTVSGDTARVRGRYFGVSQAVQGAKGGIHVADININDNLLSKHGIRTRVRLEPGRFVILSQTGYEGDALSALGEFDQSDELMLYYVVSSEID